MNPIETAGIEADWWGFNALYWKLLWNEIEV